VKVGVVGAGFVGAASANALVLRGVATEVVLVDLDERKAAAEAADVAHVTPFANPVRVTSGPPGALAGSAVVVITAGASQRPGETRLDLLGRNAGVMAELVPEVVANAPDAVLVVATNPVDVMTRVVERRAGIAPERVFGTGTMLDTARFRQIVARRLDVDVTHVHGYVVGEHGDSEVLVWSSMDIAGRPLDAFAETAGVGWTPDVRGEIEDEVVNSAYRIIEGKGATYYGVASAIARAVDVILRDRRSILTVSAWSEAFGCSLSLPRLVSGTGVVREVGVALDEDERRRLDRSATLLRERLEQLGG
jgi:L-lactate dehydrogenase